LFLEIFTVLNSIEIPQGGNNAYSGAKKGVQCSDSNILYLAFISETFFKIQKNKILEFSFIYLF